MELSPFPPPGALSACRYACATCKCHYVLGTGHDSDARIQSTIPLPTYAGKQEQAPPHEGESAHMLVSRAPEAAETNANSHIAEKGKTPCGRLIRKQTRSNSAQCTCSAASRDSGAETLCDRAVSSLLRSSATRKSTHSAPLAITSDNIAQTRTNDFLARLANLLLLLAPAICSVIYIGQCPFNE